MGIATAATTSAIGTFDPLGGSAGSYETTMRLEATGFPEAAVTSTSRAGAVGPQTGASTWFGANTPPGELFGSSRDLPYLNLRPRADTTTPSVTTYTFERPTPQGWGFVLGDIDADEVRVSAVTADGDAATNAELGFRGTFNFCDVSPRPSVCSSPRPKDQPVWVAPVLRGNATATDTDGASGWFTPTVPLESLTLTFTGRSGAPVFHTWFGVVRRDVTGTLTGSGACSAANRGVRLLDADGTAVATATTGDDGAYEFLEVPATAGWRVDLAPLPDTCVPVGPRTRPINTSTTDATADFTIREVVPAAIGGRVVTDDGESLPNVTVTIDGPAGERETTTDADGGYVFDENQPGEYTLAVTPPDGFEVVESPGPVTVPDGDESPIAVDDFVLEESAAPPTPEPTTPEPTTPEPTTPAPTSPAPSSPPPGAAAPADDALLPDTGGARVIGLVIAAIALVAGVALYRTSRKE